MIRKILRERVATQPELETLLDLVVGNIGLVFCRDDTLGEVKKIFADNKVGANAKAGTIAPNDVVVPAGDTGLDPSQTSFMQALNIATKINKGQVSIMNDVLLLKAGDKVGASEAALLQKLKITPFAYGLVVTTVYENGALRDPKSLDLTDDDVLTAMSAGIATVKAFSLGASFPTAASIPTLVSLAYKNVQAIAFGTDYTFDRVAELKAILSDPEALARLQAAAPAASSGGGKADAPAAAEEEAKSESDEDMGFGLFD